METHSKENQTELICTEVQEARPLSLVDKLVDLAIENEEGSFLIAGAIGTSIVIYTIAHSAAKLIRAVRG